jgi:hypothetical protein
MRRSDSSEEGGARPDVDASGTGATGESQMVEEEVYRIAAFRIRETANRIATLANSARDEALRSTLRLVCERLLGEERELLTRAGRG